MKAVVTEVDNINNWISNFSRVMGIKRNSQKGQKLKTCYKRMVFMGSADLTERRKINELEDKSMEITSLK